MRKPAGGKGKKPARARRVPQNAPTSDVNSLTRGNEKWEWTGIREEAALLVASDRQSDEAIVDILGIDRKTLWRWRQVDAFRARVDFIRAQLRAEILQHGIAVRENRVRRLDERTRLLDQVMEERGAMEEHKTVPGWTTGLITHEIVHTKAGNLLDRYRLDTNLLGELRAHEKQAAQEVGEWTEKRVTTTSGSITLHHRQDLSHLTDPQLKQLEEILRDATDDGTADA
jgi:hypothetical protein